MQAKNFGGSCLYFNPHPTNLLHKGIDWGLLHRQDKAQEFDGKSDNVLGAGTHNPHSGFTLAIAK